MNRGQNAGFLSPRSSKITVTKEKERKKKESARRRKEGEEKKAMVVLLVFIIATLEIVFGRNKLLDARGPFRENKENPAKSTLRQMLRKRGQPVTV